MTDHLPMILAVLFVLVLVFGVAYDDWKHRRWGGQRLSRNRLDEMAMTHKVGADVCEAFGIPPRRCTDLRIDLKGGDLVTVTATLIANTNQVGKLVRIVEQSQLRVVRDDAGPGAGRKSGV